MTDDDDPAWRAFCVRMASMIGEQRTAMGAEAAAQDGAQPLQLDIVYCAEPHPHPQPQPQPLLLERWRLASEPNDGPASAPAPATPQPVALAAAEAAVRSHLHFSLLARCRGHLQLRPAAPDAVPDELKPQRRVFPSVALAGGRRRGVVEVTSATLLPDVLKAALPPVAVVPAASRTSSAGSVASTGAEGRVDGSQARQRQVPLGLGYYGALHHKAQQHRDADGTSPDGATSRSGTPLANGNGGDTGSSTASPSGSPVSPAAAVSAASTGSAGSGGGAHVGRSFSRPAMAGSPDPRRRMLGGIPTAALPASPSAVSQPKAIPRRNTDSSTSPLGIRRGSRLAVSADTQLPFGLVSPPMFSAPGGMRRAVSEVPSVSPTPHSFRGNIEV